MPGRFVFPGGSLEPEDDEGSGFEECLAPPGTEGTDPESLARLPAFARAALRETFEETGLLIGRPAPDGTALPSGIPDRRPWTDFAAAGLVPAFAELRLFARAITPPGLARRFHARFFMADGALARGDLTGDGELEALAWVPMEACRALPMADVSRRALAAALALRRRCLDEPVDARTAGAGLLY